MRSTVFQVFGGSNVKVGLVLRSLAFILSIVLNVGALTPAAVAQTQPATSETAQAAVPAVVAEAQKKLDTARKTLQSLQDDLERNRQDDERLGEMTAAVDALTRQVGEATGPTRARLSQISARLTELGEPPPEGAPPEADLVAEERARLTSERAAINAVNGMIDQLASDVADFSRDVAGTRRQLFTDTLFKRTPINGDLLADSWRAFLFESANLNRAVTSWLDFVWSHKRYQLLWALGLSLLAALIFVAGSYRLFGPLILRHREEKDNPTYVHRLSVAFFSTTIPALGMVFFIIVCYGLLEGMNVLRPDIAPIVAITLSMMASVFFVTRLSRAVLAPSDAEWRLVKVTDHGARVLGLSIYAMVIVNALDYMLGGISEALGSPVILTIVKSLLAALIIGAILIWMSTIAPMMAEGDDPHIERGRPWPRVLSLTLRFAGIALVVSALLGYVGLARFAATQIVITGALLATMYIGILAGRAVAREGGFRGTSVGRYVSERFELGETAIEQAGLAAGLAICLLVVIFGLPVIMLLWGFQIGDIQVMTYRLFTEIRIGSISISLFGILGGVILFVFGLIVTRYFQRWLDGTVMARSQVDSGVRNSVKTAIGYAGVALAGLLGISAAGIDLSSLALVAGALSLGIGFGLQNIVSNFVSGLILLAERPFKVGDWVVSGTSEGFVRRISVRATEIETFQRQTIIVPNSEFINASVGNWTHRNALARIDVMIGVGYQHDPERVIEILGEVAKAQPGALGNPEPFVIFLGFGASSLDFQVCLFVPNILDSLGVKNGIRVAIYQRLKAEGIEIPFQKHDVNLFMRRAPGAPPLDDAEAADAAEDSVSAEETTPPAGARRTRRKP
jgi:potassium efflux system protein